LLENQLPIFVLEKLYKFAFNDSSSCNHHEEGKQIVEHKNDLKTHDAPFVKLSRKYFSDYYKLGIGEEVNYFTDLLRYLLVHYQTFPLTHLWILDIVPKSLMMQIEIQSS
jgi:hypothetical protein